MGLRLPQENQRPRERKLYTNPAGVSGMCIYSTVKRRSMASGPRLDIHGRRLGVSSVEPLAKAQFVDRH